MAVRTTGTLAAQRLAAQHLAPPLAANPVELVRSMVAIQAQDYAAAKWAVGMRLENATDAAIEADLARGAILRTHAMRGTWQLVVPEDIRWILELVRPRVLARLARRHAELGLDAVTLRKCRRLLEHALRDGASLTRREVTGVLAPIDCSGQRLPHILAVAELEGVICSGELKSSWTLLDRRAPPAPPFARGEALAELARRYFESRGPATIADFVWWSGLAAADAQAAVSSVARELVSENLGGGAYLRGNAAPTRSHAAHLLPAFDEYLVAYRDRDAVLDRAYANRINAGGGLLAPCVLAGGRVVGTWRRDAASIEIALFARAPRGAITNAARRYDAFNRADRRRTLAWL